MGKLNRPIAKRMLIEEEMSLVEATSEEPAVPVEEPEEDLSESSPSLSISVTSPAQGPPFRKTPLPLKGKSSRGQQVRSPSPGPEWGTLPSWDCLSRQQQFSLCGRHGLFEFSSGLQHLYYCRLRLRRKRQQHH